MDNAITHVSSGGPYWVRSPDGWLAGVCQGLAMSFHIPVGVLRLLWVLSTFCLGTGLGIYILLCIALPRADLWAEAQGRRVLGVCARLSQKLNMEVGLVRFLFLLSLPIFVGTTAIVYFVLHLALEPVRPVN